jgi:hypothetical protein
MERFCEHGDDTSHFVKAGNVLESLNCYQLNLEHSD